MLFLKQCTQTCRTGTASVKSVPHSREERCVMMLPSILGESLFDNFLDDFAFPTFQNAEKTLYGKNGRNLMKTDVRETNDGYSVDIDLPGFKKEEIQMHLMKGYLVVNAAKNMDKDEKDDTGKYVRRERYSGSMSRSFYVGDGVTEDDIHPRYENGILSFCLPKKDKKAAEQPKRISIQG